MKQDRLKVLLISERVADHQQLASLCDRLPQWQLHGEKTPQFLGDRDCDICILAVPGDRLSVLIDLVHPTPVVFLVDTPETGIAARETGIADYWLRSELNLAFVDRALRSRWEVFGLQQQNQTLTEELEKYKHIESTFRESEARLLELLSNTSDGILIVDRQGIIRFANPVAGKLFNCSLSELVGREFGQPIAVGEAAELHLLEDFGQRGMGEMRVTETVWQSEPVYAIALRDITDRRQAEVALEASRSQLSGILAIADDAIISINIQQKITLFNRGAEKIFGYTREEILGCSLSLLLPDRVSQTHESHIRQFSQESNKARKMGERGKILGRRKNGEEFPAEASISMLEIDGEKIFTTILRDISDRQQAEEQLQRSQHFIERVADTSPSLLYIFELVEYKNVYLNGDRSLLGYSNEEIQEMGDRFFAQILHPEDLDRLSQRLQRFQTAHDGDVIKTEYRIRNKNGQWRWLYSRDIIFSRNSDGEPKEILGVAVDISDRKEAEAQLKEYREHLEELVEQRTDELLSANQQLQQEIQERKQAQAALYFQARLLDMVEHAIIATDLAGTITYWNRGAQTLYGWFAQEVIGRNIMDVTPSDKTQKRAKAITDQLYRGESWSGEFRVKGRDGREFPAMIMDSPIYNETGELIGIVGISFDNRERKQAEEALQKANAELGITVEQQTRDLGGAIDKLQQEIVKRKLAETELQESEERFRVVLQTSPVVVFHQDTDLYYTWIYNTLDPFKPEDFIGKCDDDLFDPETAQHLKQIKQAVITSGEGTRVETPMFYGDQVFYYDMTLEPLRYRSGRIIGLTGAAIDITDRKEAEEALKQRMERERLLGQIARHVRQSLHLDDILNTTTREVRQLLQSDRVLIFRYYPDNKGIVTHESAIEGQKHLLGLEIQEEVLHRNCYHNYYQGRARILSPFDDRDGMPDCLREYLQGLGIKSALIVPLLQQNDLWGLLIAHQCHEVRQWQPWEMTLLEQLAVQVAIAIQQAELYRQLSEKLTQEQQVQLQLQQAKEAADAANHAKSEFLANMSHELRTPLNAILGFTQILTRDSHLPPEEQEYLEIINRSGEHLLSLINDILDLSKIEAGRISCYRESFDFFELLDNLHSMLHLKAESKGLSLTFYRTADLPQFIESDRQKLRSTLINLVGNAIKFTERGHVILRVGASVIGSREKITIRFEIEDTGVGIAPEELNTLFDAFVQTNVRQKLTEGTGLGLTISRHFVRLLGGDIEVKSTLGQGSTFAFAIVCPIVNEKEVLLKPRDRRIVGLESQETYRILIVEDRWTNRRLLQDLLGAIGFTLREAINGQDAIALWQEWQPHLILMDMQMPIMDGYEATRTIRLQEKNREEEFPALHPRVPIIALTASAFESQRPSILAAGCDDLIAKPFSEDNLFETIAQYLKVNYRYQTIPIASFSESVPPIPLTRQDLQQLPSEERSQLHQLALCARGRQLCERIEQFPEEWFDLGRSLLSLVDNLDFERIIELTDLDNTEKENLGNE